MKREQKTPPLQDILKSLPKESLQIPPPPELDEKGLDIRVVNRHAAILRPKQPFMDWDKSLPQPLNMPLEELRGRGLLYLLPERDFTPHTEHFVRQCYGMLFAHALWGWCMEEKLWPKNRTYDEFLRWFDVEIIDMVCDLGYDDIELEKE